MSPQATTDTRAEILSVAAELLIERGFSAFSYADLAKQVGIRKASIHYHFPAKADLGMALISYWRSASDGLMQRFENEYANVYERFQYLAKEMTEHFDCKSHICPRGAFDADLMNLPEEMRAALHDWAEAHGKQITDWLADGRERGDLAFTGEAEHQAQLLMATMQGAMQMRRSSGDDAVMQHIIQQLWASMAP